MPSKAVPLTPGLSSFLKSLKGSPVDTSIENLISLLKRRQIRHSRACATATAHLLLRVVTLYRTTDPAKLIERVQHVGRRLCVAQPRELVVGNIVRRVLGLIREEAEDDRDADFSQQSSDAGSDSRPHTPHIPEGYSTPQRPGLPISSVLAFSPLRHANLEPQNTHHHQETDLFHPHPTEPLSRPPLLISHTSHAPGSFAPPVTSMFNLLSHPEAAISRGSSPGVSPSPRFLLSANNHAAKDLRAEVIDGIGEIIDELHQADDQIASYALDHIHQNEIILTHTSSVTVQKFLLKAAEKGRRFHVIHAEAFPNDHKKVHSMLVTNRPRRGRAQDPLSHDAFAKPLTAYGCTVTLIPDHAVFALMSRVNKVILGTHAVLANGALIAAAGTLPICLAAAAHKTPVVVVSGVYKLSPVYPFDVESLIEYGDSGKVWQFEEVGEGEGLEGLEVENPVLDFVPAECVGLYVTNLGGCAPSFLYRLVGDHYRREDVSL